VYDQASLVREATRSVRDAMLVGAVLAVAILFVFLRRGAHHGDQRRRPFRSRWRSRVS
jgi:hypothetical protein